MLTISVEEPVPQRIGDVWFDPGSRKSSRAQVLHTGLGASGAPPQTLIWVPILPPGAQRGPQNKVGDIAINMTNMVPEVWDGNNWIPAVPANYSFPKQNPSHGDTWTDPATNYGYIFNGLKWIRAYAPTASQQLNIVASSPNLLMQQTSSNVLEIRGTNNQLMVSIDTSTFTIKYGLSYQPDAAARIFWEAINGLNPKLLETELDRTRQLLADRVNEISALEEEINHYRSLGIKRPYKAPKPVDPMDAWDSAMGIIK